MIDPENPRCCDCVGKGVGPSFLRIYQNILFFTPPSFFIVKSWHSLKSGLSKAHMQKFHLVDISNISNTAAEQETRGKGQCRATQTHLKDLI